MHTNHVPVADRLRARIYKLTYRAAAAHVPSSSRGNPYYMCLHCEIHDPQLSINNGKHYGNCPMQGIANEIRHYERLLYLTTMPVAPAVVEECASQEKTP